MSIIQRVPWTVQPQVVTPAGKIPGLTGLWNCTSGGIFVNLLTGTPVTNPGGGAAQYSSGPVVGPVSGRNLNSVTTRPILGTVGGLFDATNKICTIILVARRNGTTNERGTWFAASGSSGGMGLIPASALGGQLWQTHAIVGGPSGASGISPAFTFSSTPQVYALTSNGTAATAWQNGLRTLSGTFPASTWPSSTADWGLSGAGTWDSFGATDSSFYGVATFNRLLTESEIQKYNFQFWQLFAPQTRRIWVPVSAGGGISGVLSSTLADATLSATGTLALAGVLSKTLDNATLSATGTLPIVGTLAKTLDNVTLEAAGTLLLAGSASVTLGDVTLAATGALQAAGSGALAQTLADVTLAATGTLAIAGTASQTLADLTSSATGALQIQGTASVTLGALTVEATGTSQIVTTGALTATLADVTTAATATVLIKGSASVTLGDLTIVATATMPLAGISGVAAPTLEALTTAATGTLEIAGSLGVTLANCTVVAAGNDPSTDTNSAWWMYTVAADDLTYSIPADDLTYSVSADPLNYSIGV